ncbi:MAG: hypothetical protein GY765_24115, partial [bacterium]|nr:hypothetical protein [bacterium]
KQEMGCSDSMFAYSMLYPYTDNIMDHPSLSREKKFQICRYLKERLEGLPHSENHSAGDSDLGRKLDTMVGLIEKDFSRDKFPCVYQSLLGIYNAQLNSLRQHGRDLPPYVRDIPGIGFEKGGTSVLADGFLIKGQLNQREEDFCFGLGTFLQLADDIQDVVADKKNSHNTLFSHVAGKYPLDLLANKLFNYISTILEQGLTDPALAPLKELMLRSYYIHIIGAVGKNKKLYSGGYIKMLESYFPFRFSFFKKLGKPFTKVLARQKSGTVPLDVVSAGLMALSARVYEK